MKKLFKPTKAIALVMAIFLGFAGAATLQAQSSSKAKFDKASKVLSLDETAPFGYLFQLDITPMGFASKAKAEEFFSNWTTELVSFQVDFDKHMATVLLNLRSKPDWQVKEWNVYLAQLPKQ